MYKILGGDGKEYGPVTAETLRQWVNEGRASGQTQVRGEGASEWRTLASLPEFAALFAVPQSRAGPAGGVAANPPSRTSGLAVASLVTAILGCTAPVGLILGFLALKRIKASQGQLGGRGVALAGVIVSACVIGLALLLALPAAMLLPALAKAKQKAQTINCVNNLKQLGLAVRLYSGENKDTFPTATNWCDALMPMAGTPRIFQCPGDTSQLRSGYAFNAALSGMAEADIPPDTVLIFECDTGWNASGGKELLLTKSRHYKTYVIAFADGSVQQVQEGRLSQLRWNPTNTTNNSNE